MRVVNPPTGLCTLLDPTAVNWRCVAHGIELGQWMKLAQAHARKKAILKIPQRSLPLTRLKL